MSYWREGLAGGEHDLKAASLTLALPIALFSVAFCLPGCLHDYTHCASKITSVYRAYIISSNHAV